jgi:F-type H+-transporting ATPase subunit b
LEQLGLNLGYLLVQIVCFFIIFVVVRAWIVKPLLGMLDKRRAKLEQGLEDARIAAEARANAEQEASKILTEAQSKASRLINDATERADAAMEEVKAETEKELAKEREAVMAEAEVERNRILADLRGQVAALSIAAAQKLIGESMDSRRQHQLLDEFFSGVKAGKLVLLEGASVSGEAAELTSALPLTSDEQAEVRKSLQEKLGGKAAVEFRVDPQILGGVVVRVGDKVLDGSVASQLEEMRKAFK